MITDWMCNKNRNSYGFLCSVLLSWENITGSHMNIAYELWQRCLIEKVTSICFRIITKKKNKIKSRNNYFFLAVSRNDLKYFSIVDFEPKEFLSLSFAYHTMRYKSVARKFAQGTYYSNTVFNCT